MSFNQPNNDPTDSCLEYYTTQTLPYQIQQQQDSSEATTKKELWGWYGYGWASEPYS